MTFLPFSLQLIADATTGGSVSESFVLQMIAKILAGVGTVVTAVMVGIHHGKKKAQPVDATIKHPVPTITVKEDVKLVTVEELEPRLDAIETSLEEIKSEAGEARRVARDSQGRTHQRVDAVAKEVAHLAGMVSEMKENLRELLRLAMTKPPRRRPGD